MLENPELVTALLAALGGAILVPIMQFISSLRKERRDDFILITQHLQAEILRLSKDNEILKARIAHLETMSLAEIPVPMWSKDRQGHYQWVNAVYSRTFLEPRGMLVDDILGKTDDEIWSEHVSARIKTIDSRALFSKSKQAVERKFQFSEKTNEFYTVVKWSLMSGSIHTGWMGMAIAEE